MIATNRFPHRVIAVGTVVLTIGFSPLEATAFAQQPELSPVVAGMVDNVIIPAYGNFASAADRQVQALTALCSDPGPEGLASAKEAFSDLVEGFARVEAMRFGPAREDNRFEKLFFWPDRRGRGQRQVEEIIRTEDSSALDPDELAGKSVAVQGVLALDYALADQEAAAQLLRKGSFRCGYALAVSRRISAVAHAIHDAWRAPDGFGAKMKNAGPAQQIYRTPGEAMQELLRSATEILTIVREFKIARVIGESRQAARIQRAPLWRSGNWLHAVKGNIAFAEALFADDALAALLPEQEASLPQELRFELLQAGKAIGEAEELIAEQGGAEDLGEEPYAALSYATLPLHGAAEMLEGRLPPALGLIIGFNSLDGD